MTDRWRSLAAIRARREPGLVAHAWRDIPDAALLDALGCDEATLHRVMLCYAPRPGRRDADLDAIAGRFGVDREAVAALAANPPRPGRPPKDEAPRRLAGQEGE
jgi:hypothetical protein